MLQKTNLTITEININSCKDLKERGTKTINYEKKMITLVYEGNKYVIKSKKLVIYAKKNLILTKMI